jgi:hypothetical protein
LVQLWLISILGMGLTIVDSIDTMYLMGHTSEYNKARLWIAEHLDFDKNVCLSFHLFIFSSFPQNEKQKRYNKIIKYKKGESKK